VRLRSNVWWDPVQRAGVGLQLCLEVRGDGMTSEAGTRPRPTKRLPFPTMRHSNVIAWPALGI
jgi:hypothetical protein